MRKLIYVCKIKDSATVKTASFAQAQELKASGWKVTEVLETIPEPNHCAPLQWERRVKI